MIEGIQFMIDLLTFKKHAEISADIYDLEHHSVMFEQIIISGNKIYSVFFRDNWRNSGTSTQHANLKMNIYITFLEIASTILIQSKHNTDGITYNIGSVPNPR
jgi:hypothetical protein